MAKVFKSTALNATFLDDVVAAKTAAETASGDALAILEGGEHSTEGTITAAGSVEGLHDEIENTILPAVEEARDQAVAAAADPILAFVGLERFETDPLDYVLDDAYVTPLVETNCAFDPDGGVIGVIGSVTFACTLRVTLGAGGAPNPMYLVDYLSWFLYDSDGVWTGGKLDSIAATLTLRNSGGTSLGEVAISEKSDQGINLKGAFEIARGAAYYIDLAISGQTLASAEIPVGSFFPSRYPSNPYITLTDGDGRYAALQPNTVVASASANVGAGYADTETVRVTTGGITLTLENASALTGRTILFLNEAATSYEFAADLGVTLRPSGLTTAAAYGHVWVTFRGPTVHLSGDIS